MIIENLVSDLLDGKTSDEIAEEMAEALNAAIKEKEAIEKEAEEKRITEEKSQEAKKSAVEAMLSALYEYLLAADTDQELLQVFENFSDEDVESLVKAFDKTLKEMACVIKLTKIFTPEEHNEIFKKTLFSF